jgi:hypothetical protein
MVASIGAAWQEAFIGTWAIAQLVSFWWEVAGAGSVWRAAEGQIKLWVAVFFLRSAHLSAGDFWCRRS